MKIAITAAALALVASGAGAAALDLNAEGYSKGETLFATDAASADNVFGSFAANGTETRGALTLSGFDPYSASDFSFVLRGAGGTGNELVGTGTAMGEAEGGGFEFVLMITKALGDYSDLAGGAVFASVTGGFDLDTEFFGETVGLSLARLSEAGVTAVPLPPALALMLGGLAGIGALRFRRRAA